MEQITLQDIKDLLKPLTDDIKDIKNDIKEMKTDIQELKKSQEKTFNAVTELDPKNANKHLEINEKINNIDTNVNYIKEEFVKLKRVTSENCYELQYLKTVK